ncbi:MAG TPA: macro domain-containing protein, partial [Bryobacteraceae bacterium]|nr:macro domain-containing protein [Bryobacteraceae bacterium]
IGRCPTGSAVVTAAGALPAQYVFHAVGPVYRGGEHGEPQQLASCYRECLKLAEERGVKRISFPSISTGAYGYPTGEAAAIAIEQVRRHLEQPGEVEEATFVLFDQRTYAAYAACLPH